MTTDTPRRNWHLTRWLLLLIVATLSWNGWRAYTFRSALAQAKALGWEVEYTDPVERIQRNWKAAFKNETWLGVTHMDIPTSESFEQNALIVHRLNPERLRIENASTFRDLSALSPLDGLRYVELYGCTGLTNIDALKEISALRVIDLSGCTELTNVDALKHLSSLQEVVLNGCAGLRSIDALKNLTTLQSAWLPDCTGLKNVAGLKNLPSLQRVNLTGCTGLDLESVAALKAALPDATIIGP